MTLCEKIRLADSMIRADPDSTVKDFIQAVANWKERDVIEEKSKKTEEEILVIQEPIRPRFKKEELIFTAPPKPFIYTYLGAIRELQQKYEAKEDQIINRPKADYSNRSAKRL